MFPEEHRLKVFENKLLEEYLEESFAASVPDPNIIFSSFSPTPSFHVLFLEPITNFNTDTKQHGRYSVRDFIVSSSDFSQEARRLQEWRKCFWS
jgi:hypothetical protein